MFSVFKRSSDRKNKSAPYRIKYKDGEGRWRTKVGCTDKQTTERMARKLADEAALQRAGLQDPQEARRRNQRIRPLADHLDDYDRAIVAKNRTAKSDRSKHVDSTRTYINWVAEVIKADRIDDLTSSAVQEAIARIMAEGGNRLAPATPTSRPSRASAAGSGATAGSPSIPWTPSSATTRRPIVGVSVGHSARTSWSGSSGPPKPGRRSRV